MEKKQKRKITIVIAVLSCALLASIGANVWQAFRGWDSYLQDPEEIYIMEAGILSQNLQFSEGEDIDITYDLSHSDYATLREKYRLEEIAGDGSEFDKALRLMDQFAPRLTHASNYDNHVEMAALPLLEYSLDRKSHGINCRAKAQILNECCLALGIYSRKVWIMPLSPFDNDCHVVNEVWDTALDKWVMLDITNNQYWVDESGTPLSVLEIRTKGAEQEFCTPVVVGEKTDNLQALREKHMGSFIYIMKNMAYTEYCTVNTVGEGETIYLLFPENLESSYQYILSESSVTKSPIAVDNIQHLLNS
ncbi:MAG: transglutaminase domain-containing protein [Ruminococcaceae bacterium]|nr:transglutaminase domain-containing protein [Oscillospiraceae bacterium]